MSLPQPPAGGAPWLRRGALATVLALSLFPLAACAAGNHADTLQVRPDHAATSVGDIEVQNAVVLTQATGSTGSSVISAKVFNNGADEQTIESVTVGDQQAELSGSIKVPGHGSVLIGGDGNPSATVAGGTESKNNGDFQKVVFDFSRTGEVTLQTLALPATGYYASFGPTGSAASPTGSASAGATGKPSGNPSTRVSESATGSPTP